MSEITEILENTKQPSIEALADAAIGFQPNEVSEINYGGEAIELAYDYEADFIGVKRGNNGSEDFEHLIAIANGSSESYVVCQMYGGGMPQIWLMEKKQAYWLNAGDLEESGLEPEAMVGVDLDGVEELVRDFKAGKRSYFE